MTKSMYSLPEIAMGESVPRILHQHFLAGDAAIPEEVRRVRDALVAANPGWTYSFWDAARAEAFIEAAYGEGVLERYRRIRPEYYAARSDLLRYLTLYVEGGVYLDIKSTCNRPLDEALRSDDRFLLLHFAHMMAETRTPNAEAMLRDVLVEIASMPNGEYVQWVIASVPGHPYLRAVIDRVLRNIDSYSPLWFGVGGAATLRATGPVAYSLTIEKIRDLHPHTGPMNALDRGFVYSGIGDGRQHPDLYGASTYYYNLTTPVVESSPASYLLFKALMRLKKILPVSYVGRRVRALFVNR